MRMIVQQLLLLFPSCEIFYYSLRRNDSVVDYFRQKLGFG